MSIFTRLRHLLGGQKELSPEDLAREEELKKQLRERCARFRRLLSSNKNALEIMSEVEEALAGSRPFGMSYVRGAGTRAATAVYQMVRELNALSDNQYESLQTAFNDVSGRITDVLERKSLVTDGPLLLPLTDIRLGDMPQVGGKMANLGEVSANVGLAVPDGFAVTVNAYHAFMEYNGLRDEISRRIQSADMDSMDDLFSLSAALQQCILNAPLPPQLEQAIEEAVAGMVERCGSELRLALRSSAVGEDALGVTFAGQYRSELNVLPEEACEVWKEIVASKYAVTAMSYRFQRGIPDEAAPMSVGVLSMVQALAGGVAYSRDPVASRQGRGQVTLNAVPGLPQAVVDGAVTPDVFAFSRQNPPELLEKHIAYKAFRLDCAPEAAQGVSRSDLEDEAAVRPSLTDAQARELAQVALALEEFYNEPQDVEWALEPYEGNTRIVVLQSRPLFESAPDQVEEAPAAVAGEEDPGDLPVLAQGGMAVSSGVAVGPVFVARKDADMLSFPRGGILVIERAQPRWATLLSRAAGLISETGGMAGHLASVAREYKLPALFSLKDASHLLENAGEVTLLADRGTVLAGSHPELIPAGATPPNLMAGSPVYQRLKELAALMTPLHLLDPDSPDFSPANCTSLHDITRFCHEKAVGLMFDSEAALNRNMGKQLKVGVKLQYWVIDMDDGFKRSVNGPLVELGDIACKPMLALWNGMVAVPWAGPPATSASGFMSVVFESTMNRELESTAPTAMADKNFFIIASRYMILQARYGYHFCTVECLAGEDEHENFVSFQFKGGAADVSRRILRARMLADLLESHGFRVDIKNDSMFAVAEAYNAEETLRRTRLIGYLLIHSRQVDMIMKDAVRAAALKEKLAGDMATLMAKPLQFS